MGERFLRHVISEDFKLRDIIKNDGEGWIQPDVMDCLGYGGWGIV